MNKTTIYFKYGSMNSGKSLELLKVAYNYEENGIVPLILKPHVDTRAKDQVVSRTGISKEAHEIDNDIEVLKDLIVEDKKVVLVDEAQFLSPEVIEEIVRLSYENKISSLMFFGLKVDFRGKLFEGSKKIIEMADKIEESTSICWCGKKARHNARVVNGKITKDGPTILVEDNVNVVDYVTLCNYHYFYGMLGDENEKQN